MYVSFITELELLGYKEITAKEEKQIKMFLNDCVIININEHIKKLSIEIRREQNLKLPDSIIAATSKYLDIPLITGDEDFNQMQDIDVILYELS